MKLSKVSNKKILSKKNSNKKNYLTKMNVLLTDFHIKLIVLILIVLMSALLFRKYFSTIIEKLIVFFILALLILLISKNIIITIVSSIILFLLINLVINYKNTIENFDNEIEKEKEKEKDTDVKALALSEPDFNLNVFDSSDISESTKSITDLLKKVNGGIELTDDDTKETGLLEMPNLASYSDDKKPNALKHAQKETYELINTVNALKDTLTTLSPILQEGKKLMGLFENISI